MATIAYCTNCGANFSDPADVASIMSAAPYLCTSCTAFAVANPAQAVVEQQAEVAHATEELEAEESGEQAEPAVS